MEEALDSELGLAQTSTHACDLLSHRGGSCTNRNAALFDLSQGCTTRLHASPRWPQPLVDCEGHAIKTVVSRACQCRAVRYVEERTHAEMWQASSGSSARAPFLAGITVAWHR